MRTFLQHLRAGAENAAISNGRPKYQREQHVVGRFPSGDIREFLGQMRPDRYHVCVTRRDVTGALVYRPPVQISRQISSVATRWAGDRRLHVIIPHVSTAYYTWQIDGRTNNGNARGTRGGATIPIAETLSLLPLRKKRRVIIGTATSPRSLGIFGRSVVGSGLPR